jgi:hypothetical protein
MFLQKLIKYIELNSYSTYKFINKSVFMNFIYNLLNITLIVSIETISYFSKKHTNLKYIDANNTSKRW